MIQLPITFINEPTRKFYECTERHSLICGGFGSGKTFVGVNKLLTLATSFNNYRTLIARYTYKKLKETTMKTFYKICPPELYHGPIGRRNDYDGYLRFINGSEFHFVHLDDFNEELLRGIELNSAFLDQAEELPEGIVDVLDTRLGRWDQAKPVQELLANNPSWERNDMGHYKIPAYLMLTCNPETEIHWLWRKYHPDSLIHRNKYSHYKYFEVSAGENPYLDKETYKVMLSRDPSWVKRFVHGKWGISEATIHKVLSDSIINPSKEWIENLLKKAILIRSFDHGESAPTCCLWWATWEGQYICFREYYQPHTIISKHRANINDLSADESYSYSVADPQMFKKQAQKLGGFWSISDEYADHTLESTPLHFIPGDNNELSTRNRINEYLQLDPTSKHPLTGVSPAPRIYFIEHNPSHAFGCYHVVKQAESQRRMKVGSIEGKDIYSDERQMGIEDHAYDGLRYYVASHAGFPKASRRAPPANSFAGIRKQLVALKMSGLYNAYGDLRPRA